MYEKKKLDCCFLVCGNSKKTYQDLSKTYSAIEPPTWALLLAESTRSIGFKVSIIDANAENLPFNDNYFDKYIISFCLRNVTDIKKALEEALRVLKPGGIFYCLEFSKPESFVVEALYKNYKKYIIPLIGEKITKNRKAYKYLEESIDQFPTQKELLRVISQIGFQETKCLNMFNGIVAVHSGFKV